MVAVFRPPTPLTSPMSASARLLLEPVTSCCSTGLQLVGVWLARRLVEVRLSESPQVIFFIHTSQDVEAGAGLLSLSLRPPPSVSPSHLPPDSGRERRHKKRKERAREGEMLCQERLIVPSLSCTHYFCFDYNLEQLKFL